jgi:hypothetical protein
MNKRFAAITILTFTLSLGTFAQTSGPGKISGSVFNNQRQAVSRALVIVSKDGLPLRRAITNALGSFTFSGLPPGSYVLQACSDKFGLSSLASVEIAAGIDAKQDLTTELAFFPDTGEPGCATDPQTSKTTHYSGAIMSVDQQGDIKDFFRRIASISGLELDVGPSVNRDVTVHLKNVPWDLALDVVVSNSGLYSAIDGKVLRITMADPLLGQDRLLIGTVTIEGKITAPLQINAPNANGEMQIWPVEWQTANALKEMLKVGDQVVVTGSLTRRNTIDLVSIRRMSDGFSWGDTRLGVRAEAPSDSVMFVSSSPR